jgi:hypothetical protein
LTQAGTAVRKLEIGIPAVAFLGLLFWGLFLRPAFLRGPMEALQAFLERMMR